MKKIEHQILARHAYQALRGMILAGEHKPNEKLVQAYLAARFEISADIDPLGCLPFRVGHFRGQRPTMKRLLQAIRARRDMGFMTSGGLTFVVRGGSPGVRSIVLPEMLPDSS